MGVGHEKPERRRAALHERGTETAQHRWEGAARLDLDARAILVRPALQPGHVGEVGGLVQSVLLGGPRSGGSETSGLRASRPVIERNRGEAFGGRDPRAPAARP